MRRVFCVGLLLSAISLVGAVICLSSAAAAPTLQSLGQINEGLSVPTRLDIDSSGNLYVADPRQKTIFVYDKYGKPIAELAVATLSGGGLAVTTEGTKLYAACGQEVLILDAKTGEQLGQLGGEATPFLAVGFIDVDPQGNIYVADTQQRKVLVFSPDGELLQQFGDPASATGQFASIFALAVDPASAEIYVGDSVRTYTSQSKVMVFSQEGELLRTYFSDDETIFGTPPLFFFGGITFDQQGQAYFLDTYRSDVRIVQLPSTYQASFAMPSLLPGNMERPVDAAFDTSTQRLFVACDGGRVEVFGLNGAGNPDPNSPPGIPTLFHPIAGSETDTVTPQLTFQNADDPDQDVLKYDVTLNKDDVQIALYEDLPQFLPTSFAQVDLDLLENALYSWSARAKDASTASAWTAEETFYVNAVQEAPVTPEIVLPAEVPTLDGSGQLAWLASSDPDPYDTIRYRVDLFSAANQVDAVATHELTETLVTLSTFKNYSQLDVGETYSWQVTAIDNHDLASAPSVAGEFVYDTTSLLVEADIPEAQVYLGGNHAYAGRYLGQVPVELRDIATGSASVVVECPGYEPYVYQVTIEQGDQVVVNASLVAALEPAWKVNGSTLLETGQTEVVPFFVDFDNNGLIDLLIGDSSGAITLYQGVPTDEIIAFSKGTVLDLPLVPGAAPFAADWDNDGRKDLLVGGSNGTITLFKNIGTENAPQFDEGLLQQAADGPITVSGKAVPILLDLDGDHDKDLLVGTGDGEILLFENTADDAQPTLAVAQPLASISDAAAPFAVDWNADGARDLLLTENGDLVVFLQGPDGSYAQKTIIRPRSMGGSKYKLFTLGSQPFLFAFDLDNTRGKDLLVGNKEGTIQLFRSAKGSSLLKALQALADAISGATQAETEENAQQPSSDGPQQTIESSPEAEGEETESEPRRSLRDKSWIWRNWTTRNQ